VAYEVAVETVEARRLVALGVRATKDALPIVIPRAFDTLYGALSGATGAVLGQNMAYYPDGKGLLTDDGTIIYVGVEAKSFFMLPKDLVAEETPSGVAACVTHWGAYNKLPEAHQALHSHCAQKGFQITGVNWEIYGAWSDDISQVRTDIYYELI
jgi:predicted transcriptional regulator YdeE